MARIGGTSGAGSSSGGVNTPDVEINFIPMPLQGAIWDSNVIVALVGLSISVLCIIMIFCYICRLGDPASKRVSPTMKVSITPERRRATDVD
jgi:hypothetical protein